MFVFAFPFPFGFGKLVARELPGLAVVLLEGLATLGVVEVGFGVPRLDPVRILSCPESAVAKVVVGVGLTVVVRSGLFPVEVPAKGLVKSLVTGLLAEGEACPEEKVDWISNPAIRGLSFLGSGCPGWMGSPTLSSFSPLESGG